MLDSVNEGLRDNGGVDNEQDKSRVMGDLGLRRGRHPRRVNRHVIP